MRPCWSIWLTSFFQPWAPSWSKLMYLDVGAHLKLKRVKCFSSNSYQQSLVRITFLTRAELFPFTKLNLQNPSSAKVGLLSLETLLYIAVISCFFLSISIFFSSSLLSVFSYVSFSCTAYLSFLSQARLFTFWSLQYSLPCFMHC